MLDTGMMRWSEANSIERQGRADCEPVIVGPGALLHAEFGKFRQLVDCLIGWKGKSGCVERGDGKTRQAGVGEQVWCCACKLGGPWNVYEGRLDDAAGLGA